MNVTFRVNIMELFIVCAIILYFPVAAIAQAGNVCVQCHGSLEGKLGEPVKLWKGSVHAENGVACNECHGGDPKDAANAMSPSRGFIGVPKEKYIPEVCGRCHVGVKKDYLASAHGRALAKGGPTCFTCHGNHAVKKASLDLINSTSCSSCHGYEKARELKSAMSKTEAMIIATDDRISAFKMEGVDTESMEKSLFSARNQFHTLSHELDIRKVRDESAHIAGQLKKLDSSLGAINKEHQKRRIIGAIAVVVTLLAVLFLYLLRKTYD